MKGLWKISFKFSSSTLPCPSFPIKIFYPSGIPLCLRWDNSLSCQFSSSVVSDFLRPHGLHHARPPCPSPIPGVYSDPCPLSGEGNSTPLQYSCLENPVDGGAWWDTVHGVAKSWIWLSDFTFTFHFHALEKEMATHSSVLAWRIPATGEPGGPPSMGSHRVRHDWSDLAAACPLSLLSYSIIFKSISELEFSP